MATTRRIVEEEIGNSTNASLISAAIQILANENYAGAAFTPEKVINLAWKAKHMVEANASRLAELPVFEQQHIIKLYLEGQSVANCLRAVRRYESILT